MTQTSEPERMYALHDGDRSQIRHWVDMRHVGTDPEDLEQELRVRIHTHQPDAPGSLVNLYVAHALECHRENLELYCAVTTGNFSRL